MRLLAPVLAALLLAGCTQPPEQRYVVRLLGAEGATVDVPLPVDADGAVAEFVHSLEVQKGRLSFEFVDTEHGPALRLSVPEGGGDDAIASARQVGAQPLTLTLRADAGSHWVRTTAPVAASVILGDTTPPQCPELRLDGVVDGAGWARVPLVAASRCP